MLTLMLAQRWIEEVFFVVFIRDKSSMRKIKTKIEHFSFIKVIQKSNMSNILLSHSITDSASFTLINLILLEIAFILDMVHSMLLFKYLQE